ncbi:hypothetical protein AMECASPLE_029832 [Ameca splendens]|uniref:Uncharacterized protein n=1 Tax=Ameca splendens TaxID=208324 RepID=A0ABV0YT30_9TELE
MLSLPQDRNLASHVFPSRPGIRKPSPKPGDLPRVFPLSASSPGNNKSLTWCSVCGSARGSGNYPRT